MVLLDHAVGETTADSYGWDAHLALACNAIKLDLLRKLDEFADDDEVFPIQHNRR